jgi:hypothetical protein
MLLAWSVIEPSVSRRYLLQLNGWFKSIQETSVVVPGKCRSSEARSTGTAEDELRGFTMLRTPEPQKRPRPDRHTETSCDRGDLSSV